MWLQFYHRAIQMPHNKRTIVSQVNRPSVQWCFILYLVAFWILHWLDKWFASRPTCSSSSSGHIVLEDLMLNTVLIYIVCSHFRTLRYDKVSMLTHTCPHKPLMKTERTIYNRQVDSRPFTCDLSALVIYKEKTMVIYDTKCPYWDQVSLNNTKSTSLLDS